MASDYTDAPIPAASSSSATVSVSVGFGIGGAGGGVRNRRTSSEASSSANYCSNNHLQQENNNTRVFAASEENASSQYLNDNNNLSNNSKSIPSRRRTSSGGGVGRVVDDTEVGGGSRSLSSSSWWRKIDCDGEFRRRLANMMDFFKNNLIFRLPASFSSLFSPWRRRIRVAAQYRTVIPNHVLPPITNRRHKHPNRRYAGNKIKTTKYSVFTFLPKNLFEQFHRFANLYFVFVVLLNWIPQIEAFGKELSMFPVLFVLFVTALKDIFEDRRRYLADRKVNHATCRVFNVHERRYVKTEWKDVIVGDFVHLSCNEIIPADMLLVHSSDPMGICYVETSNLDGESNLKQRHAIASLLDRHGDPFSPADFKSTIECEQPNNQIYKFNGFLLHDDGQRELINKNNLLLRESQIRNTDYVEGIVVYAGSETKAMLNNSGPRYKRSKLERLMNWDIVWCVVLLLIMCFIGAVGGGIWLSKFDNPSNVPYLAFVRDKASMNPELEGFLVFWTYIIVLQVMIPISLYVSVEIVKLGQIFFLGRDPALYHAPTKKKVQCRALNIPEELGQIEYVMSDKTGTLTENQMIFRRCAVAGVDYGSSNSPGAIELTEVQYPANQNQQVTNETSKDVRPNLQLQQLLIAACSEQQYTGDVVVTSPSTVSGTGSGGGGDTNRRQTYFDFFVNMAICNTVVVNPHPHSDRMNASGVLSEENTQDISVFSNNNNVIAADGVAAGNHHHHHIGNGTLPTPAAAPSPTPRGQTPIDFPSPRYKMTTTTTAGHNGKNNNNSPRRHNHSLPTIITTEHAAAGDYDEDDGAERRARGEQRALSVQTAAEEEEEEATTPSVVKTRPTSLHFGKKLLQLPILAKGRLPPMMLGMIGRKAPGAGTPSVSPGYRNPVYEAESPDELALVYAAAAYGFRLVKRQLNSMTVELPNGELIKYEIMHILPFDAIRKRMSVVVRHPKTKRIQLFCKGADSAVMEILSSEFCQSQRGQMYVYKSQEYLNLYASYGLRTLCVAKRDLDPEEYAKWAAIHEDAELSLDDDREQLIFHSALSIEKELELLGVTGIEDRLQEGVADCIGALRQAGIKVWVLTGDKIETAVNIAYACKLFVYGMELIQLCTRNEEDAETLLQHHLDRLSQRSSGGSSSSSSSSSDHIAVVVDGQTLTFFLTPKLEAPFVRLISKCTSVLCCRTTPLQKASVVRLVKAKLGGMTLAIGDGANDVSMIQCADVGIGLSGQEGMQAVMASDFAMPQFHFMQRLLLVHGHWCYDRLTRTVLYFFYKNALFVFTIFWFQIFNGFTAQVVIDPTYMMLHNLWFTSVPPLLLGVIDQDVPASVLLKQHSLYRQGPKALLYRTHSFWLNMLDAVWQSLVCYFFPHFMFIDSVGGMWNFGFLIESALVFCNLGHLLLILHSWTIPTLFAVVSSVLFFYAYAILYNLLTPRDLRLVADCPYWIAQRMIQDVRYWLMILVIVVAALFPRFVTQTLVNTIFPTDIFKARVRDRLKRKKSASGGGKGSGWAVAFANKTKSVSFLKHSTKQQQSCAVPPPPTTSENNVHDAAITRTDADCGGGGGDQHHPISSDSDTAQDVRV